jgi:cobalt-zinc-cadmium efflux system membrane fusion protein
VEGEEYERGPQGGRWLEDGEFALELSIFESGVSPEFRAFVYEEGAPLDPANVSLEVTLRRLGGRVDRFTFEPSGGYLRGDREVEEPHSFEVEIVAREAGRQHRFAYTSYENRVTLSPEQIESAGIQVVEAGPATIRERIRLNGRIAPNEDALAHVMPRFAGEVHSVHKRLGDAVARGDLLAVIESNESLHRYELRAPQAGTVIEKNVAPGEFVSNERELFAIADLSSVWADLDVYRRDIDRLRVGQPIRADPGGGAMPTESTLSYLSPIGSVNTQTLLARAVLPNPAGAWRPGLFLSAEVEVAAVEAAVVVVESSVQRLGGRDVVFVAGAGVFEAQPVVLGRSDGDHIEIVSGLAPGQRYAAAGSFVLKAEAGKSGASHDH